MTGRHRMERSDFRAGIRRACPAMVLAVCLAASDSRAADYEFIESAAPAGLTGFVQAPGQGTGVAVADYDADGDLDIFLPAAEGAPNLLFRNRGSGTFEEIGAVTGLNDTRQARGGLWLDYDGDGDLDLFVSRDCHLELADCSQKVLSLYEQDAGVFTEISDQVGLTRNAGVFPFQMHAGGLSAGDISGDGLPDIFFARWQSEAELYVSDGLGLRGDDPGYIHASDVTGIGSIQMGHWQGLFHDFDGDHWPDLFVNVDFAANQLWLNGQDMTFADAAVPAGVDTAWNEMGAAPGDYDNDGDIDLYATNIHGWMDEPDRGNRLYRNDTAGGVPAFADVADVEGVDDTGWGWGAAWLDADNDGDLDLAVTNGYCQDGYCDDEHRLDRSRLFHHEGIGAGFSEIGQTVGFDDTFVGGALVAADFDRDGRLDLIQTVTDYPEGFGGPVNSHVRLLMNRPANGAATGPWLVIRPRMAGPNSHALGAVVRAVLDDATVLTRLITAGTSWQGQEPAEAHFGLGAGRDVLRVDIEWSGTDAVSTWGGPAAGRVHTLCCRDHLFTEGFE